MLLYLGEIGWPSDDDEVAEDAKQLILRLLDEDPSKRLGKFSLVPILPCMT